MFSLALAAVAGPWVSWRPATCLPDDCFCETLRDGLVRQPVNTWSSLAFVAVAVWVAWRFKSATRRGRPPLAPVEAGLLIGSLVAVGLGSAFYHASFTFVGQVLDVSGMYFIASFMLLHRAGASGWRLPVGLVPLFLALNALLMAAQVTTPGFRRILFGLLLAGAVVLEWRMTRAGRKWLLTGAGLLGGAFAIWVLDRERVVCDPASLLQGHALWHVLGALAAASLYRSYEAEASITA